MHTSSPDIIFDALREAPNAIAYQVSRHLAALFPSRFVLETDSGSFELDEFAERGRCTLTVSRAVHAQVTTDFRDRDKGAKARLVQGWRGVAWNGQLLEVLSIGWESGGCSQAHHFVIADREPVARAFFEAVCRDACELRDQVLVFQGGWWQKDEDLYADIRSARLEELVLAGDLRERLCADFERWLGSRALYEEHGVAWKRGVLLLGPPGNGKSHCIKALVRHLGLPCLYVRSFAARHATDHDTIRRIFDRARDTTPCLLVLEDLDALVTDRNRAVLLNELDGFASNAGLLTIATTNHPERLDPAILERPSRFDRKYTFELPGLSERARYLGLRNARLGQAMRMTSAELDTLAERTHGFSFAYLQELVVSAMMRWISAGTTGTLATVALAEIGALRSEMIARAGEPPLPARTLQDEDAEE